MDKVRAIRNSNRIVVFIRFLGSYSFYYIGSYSHFSINSSFSKEKIVTIQSYTKLTLKLSKCKRETSHKLQCMNMCTNLYSNNAI